MSKLIAQMDFPSNISINSLPFSLRLIEKPTKYDTHWFTYIQGERGKGKKPEKVRLQETDYFDSLATGMLNFGQRCAPFIAEINAQQVAYEQRTNLRDNREGI